MTTAVEIVEFTTDPSSEEAMLAARPAAITALRDACPGLIDARLFRGEQPGTWIDVLFWRDLDAAQAAATVAPQIPEAAAFFGHLTGEPSLRHGTLVDEDLDG